MPAISFVVPIYKAGKYVGPCVASLLRQGVEDLEILLIDDCSPDDTYEYTKELFRDDGRVRVIRQEKNGGPGQARNRGIEEATGDYICFADVDDIYADGAAREMLDVAVRHDADVYYSNELYFTVAESLPDDLSGLSKDHLIRFGFLTEAEAGEEGKITLAGAMQERVENWLEHRYHWTAFGKLFRRSFLQGQGIRFPQIKLGEDQLFTLNALIHAPVFLTQNRCFYIYRAGSVNSLSRGSRNVKVFVDGLRSLFGSIEWMSGMFAGIPYFEQHPEAVKTLIDYQVSTTENEFTIPKYQEIGRDELTKSGEVHKVFTEFFGKKGAFVEKTLFDAYDGKDRAIKEEDKADGAEVYHSLKKMKDEVGDGIFCLLGRE